MAPNADGRLEVFITGNDGNLYHAWQTAASNGWDFWDSLGNGGAPLTNGPAVAPNGDGRLEVFVLGGDGALWTRSQTVASTNDWSEWVSLGTAHDPTQTVIVPNLFEDTATVATNKLYSRGLVPQFTGPTTNNAHVASQGPAAGAVVPRETL